MSEVLTIDEARPKLGDLVIAASLAGASQGIRRKSRILNDTFGAPDAFIAPLDAPAVGIVTANMTIEHARAKLGDLITAATFGDITIITRYGKPAAKVIPHVYRRDDSAPIDGRPIVKLHTLAIHAAQSSDGTVSTIIPVPYEELRDRGLVEELPNGHIRLTPAGQARIDSDLITRKIECDNGHDLRVSRGLTNRYQDMTPERVMQSLGK